MDIKKLTEPLKTEDIELRVGHITGYDNVYTMYLLAYKTSRIDVVRLNETFGPLGWQCKYRYDEKGYLICNIGAYDETNKQWVWKEDVGTESNTEKAKGSYSDALKRAGFRWGIGTELYKIKNLKCIVEKKDIREKEYQGKNSYSYKWSLSEWELRYEANGKAQIYDNFGNLRTGKNYQSKMPVPLQRDPEPSDKKSRELVNWMDISLDMAKLCRDHELTRGEVKDIFIKSGPNKNEFGKHVDEHVKKQLDKATSFLNKNQ